MWNNKTWKELEEENERLLIENEELRNEINDLKDSNESLLEIFKLTHTLKDEEDEIKFVKNMLKLVKGNEEVSEEYILKIYKLWIVIFKENISYRFSDYKLMFNLFAVSYHAIDHSRKTLDILWRLENSKKIIKL